MPVKKSEITTKTKAKTKVTPKPVKAKKLSGLSIEVFDTQGKVIENLELPEKIFGAKINKDLISQAVRVYLANQRMGTSKTKNRGEVHGTTRKVWQQKGTGRARHGSKRAPIFVHGGIAFGPRPRDFSLSLSKKMKTQALFSALSSKFKEKEVKVIEGLDKLEPKTKNVVKTMKNLGLNDNKKILLITPVGDKTSSVYRAARNIEGVNVLSANTLNAYKVLDNKLVILMRDAVDSLKNSFIKEK